MCRALLPLRANLMHFWVAAVIEKMHSIHTLTKVFHFSSNSCRMTPPCNSSKWSSVSPLTTIIKAEFQSVDRELTKLLKD